MKVTQLCPTVCDPNGLQSLWNSPGQNTGVGSLSLLQGIFPTLGLNPGLPLQADSLPSEPQGKPKNTGVGSLSLLQWIFPTQESDWGLLPCRWILYQLSHKGSPRILGWVANLFSSGSFQPRDRTGVSLHCRHILYHLSHKGSPRILGWVASLSLLQQIFLTWESN